MTIEEQIAEASAALKKTVDNFEIWVSEQQVLQDIQDGKRCWCEGFMPCALHERISEL